MKRILRTEEMSAADAAAIRMGLPSLVLMERAAMSVVDEIEKRDYDTSAVLVVCGPGNNGGDGAAIARLLAEKGRKASLLLTGNPEKFSEQLKVQLQVCEYYGVRTVSALEHGKYTLIVDAIFGIGLQRAVTGAMAELIDAINAEDVPVVAVDICSGVAGNTGQILGTAVKADVTVTFAAGKPGHYLYPGAAYAGDVAVKEIGIPVPEKPGESRIFRIETADLPALPERDESGNKGTFGKLLVIGGSRNICGAAYFAAEAALRSGIGMVKIFTEETNRTALCTLLPEALIDTCREADFQPEALRSALDWADAVVIGPGLGTDPLSEKILQCFLEYNTLPAVWDADALNLAARSGLSGIRFTEGSVVTPHIGEMSRLIQKSAGEIKEDPLQHAAAFAREHQVVCILKDARTITAYPDGRCFVNTSGCSALATAGSGDVLAGLTGGFLLQYRKSGLPAEAMAVYLHGKLGERARDSFGSGAATAKDLIRLMRGGALCGIIKPF